MKKQIIRYLTLVGAALLMYAMGLFSQGCNQAGEALTGPTPEAVQEPVFEVVALNAGGDAAPPRPLDLCEVNRTADLVFESFAVYTTYEVFVNGEDRGALMPQGNKLVLVKAGEVTWRLIDKQTSGAHPLSGTISADVCDTYKVNAPIEPRQRPGFADPQE